MWLEANRTLDPIAPVSLDIGASFADEAVARDGDLPALRALMAALPLPLIAKCRLLQMLSAPYRTDGALERLDQLWARHSLASRDADLPARLDPAVACALAFRSVVLDDDGRPDRARSAEVWRQIGGRARLTAAEKRWVAETIAAEREFASLDGVASLEDRAQRWVIDLEADDSRAAA